MKKIILYIPLLLTVMAYAQVEKLQFDVIHNGKPLGTLSTSKKIEGSKITYTSHTNIQYHLLVSINVVYDYYVEYNNLDLIKATAHVVVRDNDKTKVKTIKDAEGYKFYSDDKIVKTIPPPLNHSVIQLLFGEPINISKVYAEEHGIYHNIKKVSPHSYLKSAPNGHKNTYHYKNGILQKSEIDAGVIQFSIVKKK